MLNPVVLIVYFNSLLGMLNARESLRANTGGGIVEIMPDELPPQGGSRHEYPPMAPYAFGKKPGSYKVGLRQSCLDFMLSPYRVVK
jgi:hypothetical protein